MSAYKYYEDKDENMGTQTIVGHGTTLNTLETVEPLKTTATNFVPGLKTKPLIEYKYNEGELIKEIQAYVDATYDQHYSRNKFQATEFIIDGGHGTGFNIGNMMKYTQRYGRKGDPKEWRKDLLKVIHYAIIQLHVHDNEYKD
jgi:hypothetical protein